VEVKSDAEHQQDDADLRKLLGKGAIGDEAGSRWTDDDPCKQVADDRRQADALCGESQHQSNGKSGGDRQDQVDVVHVVSFFMASVVTVEEDSRSGEMRPAGMMDC
jgi:hypothetical protein